MRRLIDADKLLEETRRDRDYAEKNGVMDMYYERQALIDRIDAQPTAYDVDKVAEQLEAYSNADEAERLGTMPVVELTDAITIVKGGGADAKTDS